MLAPPVAPNTALPTTFLKAPPSLAPLQPFQKPHYPLPRTKLASLVKGRWIDGKPQTVTLLRLLAICLPFLYCILFRRQDGGIATPLAPSMRFSAPSLEKHYVLASPRKRGGGLTALQNRYFHHLHFVIYRTVSKIAILLPSRRWGLLPIRTINEIFRSIPRPAPPHLPPLSKGGGLTAKHKLLPCNVLLAIHPPFLFTKLFRRQDGGIATPPALNLLPFAKSELLSPSKIPATT